MSLSKEEQKYVIESASKALISFIPFLGGAIGSIISDALADRKEQRIKDAITQLETDLEQHILLINNDFINKEDFLDVSEKTFRKLMDERSEAKRVAYKNILLTGIISEKVDYYSVEQQISILEQLSEEHLLFLKFLSSPNKYQNEVWKKEGKINAGSMRAYLIVIFNNWDYELMVDITNDLETRRLIHPMSADLKNMMSSVGPSTFENRLTRRGQKFISYIIK